MVEEKRPRVAQLLAGSHRAYPTVLLDRLGEKAPETLTAIGPVEYLAHRKTAIFCSTRTPGEAILRAHDMAVACAIKAKRLLAVLTNLLKKNA